MNYIKIGENTIKNGNQDHIFNLVGINEFTNQNTFTNQNALNDSGNLNDIDDLNEEKIIIPKKNYYCSNCNRKGHFYKNCTEPIISNGIIGIYIENLDKNLIPLLEGYLLENLKIFNSRNSSYYNHNNNPNNNHNKNHNYYCNNYNKNSTWMENNSKIKSYELNSKIKFLMIQRKKSLGYLEFIRGRYSLDDTTGIIHLLEQMTPQELMDIIKKDFDYLWNNLWDEKNIRNKNHHKEYVTSKQKFYQLKMNKMNLLNSITPLFAFNEWGFPKGRREAYESDIICALREFEEETDYKDDQYTILEECKHIRENLIGTNGVSYAHNYFLTILHEVNEFHDDTNREIGNIKVMNINECLDVIRPYHKNKIKIIKNIYLTINNFMKEYDDVDF
jgi:hypothetical protein